ncbi:MAG: LacI family DNA-binding transcriptional regulator, partial [Firmicutes bacterium]|nr:LacI family DNA-binding transcriptional regulator [Bacillota bacterium]
IVATIKDVARLAGVSISTVSIALQDDPRVRDTTRQRILAAVSELGYRPNGIARDLKQQRTNTIALFLHDMGGPFYSELVRGVQHAALAEGFSPIVACSSGGVGGDLERLLIEGRVDGAMVLDDAIHESFLRRAAGPQLPIVVLDREIDAEHVYAVTSDHEGGAHAATAHLIAQGCQRIAFISGPKGSIHSLLRQRGYSRALAEAGIAIDPRLVYAGDFTEASGYEVAAGILGEDTLPDAIFAANDEMALGVLKAASESGLQVPADFLLVGFDDIRLTQYTVPTLTTVHQQMFEIGVVGTQTLIAALRGQDPLCQQVLATELMVRDSTGCV